MIVSYGAFSFDANLTRADMQIDKVRNEGGGKFIIRKTLTLTGTLVEADEAAISAKITAVEAAFATDGLSGGLKETGGASTPHWLATDATSYRPVQVESVTWRGQSRAEYQKFRSFTIILTGDYFSTSQIISQTEEVEILGTGGPRIVGVELLNAVAQLQTTNQNTLVRAIQRGSAVWSSGSHAIPSPIWPDNEEVDRRQIGSVTIDQISSRYSRRWAYYFINVGPLILPPPPTFVFNNWTLSSGDRFVTTGGDPIVFNA